MGQWKCKVLGHKWSGIITGFTGNQEPIGRCERCNMPIVDENQEIAGFAYMCYKHGFESEEVEKEYQEKYEDTETK